VARPVNRPQKLHDADFLVKASGAMRLSAERRCGVDQVGVGGCPPLPHKSAHTIHGPYAQSSVQVHPRPGELI
jgi:hypothetical protein